MGSLSIQPRSRLDPPRVLCLSNGHGEDEVASRIALALVQLGIQVRALPIVGEGKAYVRQGIPILATPQVMPSGGFIYQDWRQLWRDLRGGLLGLTGRQLAVIRKEAPQTDLMLAVGDIVPLLMAWWSGIPYGFVGTAKSDYYWRDEQGPYHPAWIPFAKQVSDYLPWERWLMGRERCRGSFLRDELTTTALYKRGLRTFYLGNPMMDGLDAQRDLPLDPNRPALLLLPGSRPPEAYRNWALMMQVVQGIPPEIQVYAALSPNLEPAQLQAWIPPQRRDMPLICTDFGACAQRATIVLAMAGTATEQCVGLGKPVMTLPGEGPQFTPRFAEAQTRLLGSAVHLTSVEHAPTLLRQLLERLATDPTYTAHLQAHGRQRMGAPGAAQRIAAQIQVWLMRDLAQV
ncbi:lipid-A-disaccharide synthase-related protein [Synechococcus sp. Nb3U1]|uniref:lipid-A-disaccharide synthase-related protein n=1 Tax=Synechococcus sp. Nb3U1 TaxID=1914529 RepID=UPI001F3C7A01|nr:lipid-A-disaccharide synthase-related protein [Synechococcus sp. Nb3U1]MCF2972670.1 lipid-A-disaccharide synthase-related protein [Synechococcus sp. Nb3U1]